jgi:hypothetical protein
VSARPSWTNARVGTRGNTRHSLELAVMATISAIRRSQAADTVMKVAEADAEPDSAAVPLHVVGRLIFEVRALADLARVDLVEEVEPTLVCGRPS